MKIRHPRAHSDVPGKPPAKIDTGRYLQDLDDGGVFSEGEEFAEELADRFDVPFDVVDASVAIDDVDLSDDGTCTEVLTSGDREGDVCGRDLPCRFHD